MSLQAPLNRWVLRADLPPVDVYLGHALSHDDAEFFARHPWPLLVVGEPSGEVLSRIRRPETIIEEAGGTEEIDLSMALLAAASLDDFVLPIRTKRQGPGNRVSVGRASDADLVLLHQSVSRYHADISWGADKEHCFLTDLGARNGTFVDDLQISENGRVEIYGGAVLRFGQVSGRFYTPASFLAWLRGGAQRSGGAPTDWPADRDGA